jgi:4'-phosphopantetheinyl transferase
MGAVRIGAWEIDLWRIGLDDAERAMCARYERILDEDERERAAKFRVEGARERFIVSHGAMRMILGGYTGAAPEQIVYCEEANRKPALLSPAGEVRFNLTHAEGIALLAVARGLEVGIDVERVRPLRDDLGLAERFFAPEEVADLRSLSDPGEREAAFFRCWTRKEAVLKATGDGLRFPLSAFAVTLLPGEPAAVRRDARASGVGTVWTLHAFDPAPGYVAALAYTGEQRPIRFRDWKVGVGAGL